VPEGAAKAQEQEMQRTTKTAEKCEKRLDDESALFFFCHRSVVMQLQRQQIALTLIAMLPAAEDCLLDNRGLRRSVMSQEQAHDQHPK
jgi:hypothetical protein